VIVSVRRRAQPAASPRKVGKRGSTGVKPGHLKLLVNIGFQAFGRATGWAFSHCQGEGREFESRRPLQEGSADQPRATPHRYLLLRGQVREKSAEAHLRERPHGLNAVRESSRILAFRVQPSTFVPPQRG